MKRGQIKITDTHLIKEWDLQKNIVSPSYLPKGSGKKVWWRCEKGHGWEASPNSRSSNGNGCPYCVGQKVDNTNSLFALYPDLETEWHNSKNGGNTVHNVSPHSSKEAWWKCKNGHEWSAVIYSRTSTERSGCPYCSGQRVCYDNSLMAVNPQLAAEWHPSKNLTVTPDTVGANSPIKYWWMCGNGHEWMASINNRNRNGRGCSRCKKYVMADGEACDSLIEAFYYLDYKNSNLNFFHDKNYPFFMAGRYRYDFYLPDDNTYVEVTSFTEKSRHGKAYYEKIKHKKDMVLANGGKFEFVCKALSMSERKHVEQNIIGRT